MLCCSATPLVRPGTGCVQQRSADAILADVLIQTWSWHTGRALPRGIPIEELSSETLIGFWADPEISDG